MNVGRVGLAVTLLVSFPLLAVPLIGTIVRAHRELSGKLSGRRVEPVSFHALYSSRSSNLGRSVALVLRQF